MCCTRCAASSLAYCRQCWNQQHPNTIIMDSKQRRPEMLSYEICSTPRSNFVPPIPIALAATATTTTMPSTICSNRRDKIQKKKKHKCKELWVSFVLNNNICLSLALTLSLYFEFLWRWNSDDKNKTKKQNKNKEKWMTARQLHFMLTHVRFTEKWHAGGENS